MPVAENDQIETVTGPVAAADITLACSHEHLYADFLGPRHSRFMSMDWPLVERSCHESISLLKSQGVNLFVDWTTSSLGRSAIMMRTLSQQTGVSIVAATGVYKDLVPPELTGLSIDALADHFFRELTLGVDKTSIRAGFIKIATTESGPTSLETEIHRSAARAANRSGCTIALHSPYHEATAKVVSTLVEEGVDLGRLVWGHAQCSPFDEQIRFADRGITIAYDAISAKDDPFFHGPTDDESMLERLSSMVQAGHGERVLVSTDASVAVNPPEYQYDRRNAYLHERFATKLRDRLGAAVAEQILGPNVAHAFRRGEQIANQAFSDSDVE